MRILRRVRGILDTALVWGVAWAIAARGLVLALESWSRYRDGPADVMLSSPVLGMMLFYGIIGVWAGAVFASVLAVGDRRRTFADLTMARVIAWGVVGGTSYPVVAWLSALSGPGPVPSAVGEAVVQAAVLGGGSAAAMFALARRNPQGPRPGTAQDGAHALRSPDGPTSQASARYAAVSEPSPGVALQLTSGLWRRAVHAIRRSARS